MSVPLPTTREGYEKLKAEIERLEQIEMPKIAQLIAEARAEGDLRENAEYHAQRENQGMMQAKINMLNHKLANSYVLEKAHGTNSIVFGCRVTLKDLSENVEEIYEFVGPGEEDYSGEVMKILCDSPLAQQLLNHKIGEKLDVKTPGGTIKYEVMSIE